MSTKKSDVSGVNRTIAGIICGFKPPENLTVAQWADKYRSLSPESSSEPGPWRTYRTPYLKEPMEAFTDTKVKRIVMVASSQVGKSELQLNIIGYIMDQDPGSILYIHPGLDDAKKFSRQRVAPMVRDSPRLRGKVSEVKSRDSGNTILQKSFPGGLLTICGSNSASALASTPTRYVLGDERDRWAESAGSEGDPWRLATARQLTFPNAKSVEVSTPTVKNASKIEDSFSEGTMEYWSAQCPHCDEYNNIRFNDIRFDHEVKVVRHKKQFSVTKLWYVCPQCGCISTEQEMKKQPAKWIAENPDAYKRGVRSFWLNSFVSPWASWESTILELLYAEGNSKKLQVVYNTRLGELWEDRGQLEDEDSLLARREDYGQREDGSEIELPCGVLCLTCGVDTQDDRLEYEVVGYGHFGESWGIRKGIIMGRPDDSEVWKRLDEVINHLYCFENGIGLRISMTFVDEGGHFTMDVRRECRARLGRKVFAIKGRGGESIPYIDVPKKQKITIRGQYLGSCWQYAIGVDAGKQLIMDDISVQTPGTNYCHFPKREDYGPGFFHGLLSERLVYKEGKKNPWCWKKIPGHERNEALDCRNYAGAAFKALQGSIDLDEIDKKLKAAALGNIEQRTTKQKQRPTQRTRQRGGLSKHYDEW